MTGRPIFTLRLRPEPHVADPIRALRFALKALLRQHGFRALAIEEHFPPPETGEPEPSDTARAR